MFYSFDMHILIESEILQNQTANKYGRKVGLNLKRVIF